MTSLWTRWKRNSTYGKILPWTGKAGSTIKGLAGFDRTPIRSRSPGAAGWRRLLM